MGFIKRFLKGLVKSKRGFFGNCNTCGKPTIFFDLGSFTLTDLVYRNGLPCLFCRSIARERALASVLYKVCDIRINNLIKLKKFLQEKRLKIYNVSMRGVLHRYLKNYDGYVNSEYFPGIKKGEFYHGVRCEDLQDLTFADNSFDFVITEDVLEHVRNPQKALESIYRVLKPGGYHIFTVPIYGKKTITRVDVSGQEDIFLLPPVYHGDPIRSEGALAYNDFGEDIIDLAGHAGFNSKLFVFNIEDKRLLCGHVIISQKPDKL